MQIGSAAVHTPGDRLDTLVALNPAALKTNLKDLATNGILIVDRDAFHEEELAKAAYATSPLDDGSLMPYRVAAVPITTLNRAALTALLMTPREADRGRNFFVLGLICWLYQRPLGPTLCWIEDKFARNRDVAEANRRSLRRAMNAAKPAAPCRYSTASRRRGFPPDATARRPATRRSRWD